jgi:hypothetical protein
MVSSFVRCWGSSARIELAGESDEEDNSSNRSAAVRHDGGAGIGELVLPA